MSSDRKLEAWRLNVSVTEKHEDHTTWSSTNRQRLLLIVVKNANDPSTQTKGRFYLMLCPCCKSKAEKAGISSLPAMKITSESFETHIVSRLTVLSASTDHQDSLTPNLLLLTFKVQKTRRPFSKHPVPPNCSRRTTHQSEEVKCLHQWNRKLSSWLSSSQART